MNITVSTTPVESHRAVRLEGEVSRGKAQFTDGESRFLRRSLFGILGSKKGTQRDATNGRRNSESSNEAKTVSSTSLAKPGQDVKTCGKEMSDTAEEPNGFASSVSASHQLTCNNHLSTVSRPSECWDDELLTLPDHDTNSVITGPDIFNSDTPAASNRLSTVSRTSEFWDDELLPLPDHDTNCVAGCETFDNDAPSARIVTCGDNPNKLSCTINNDLAKNCKVKKSGENSSSTNLLDQKLKQSQFDAITKLLNDVLSEQKCQSLKFVERVVNDINSVLRKYFQACEVCLYGSYYSGFAVGNSDINLELFTDSENITNKFLREVEKIISENRPKYYVRFEESPQVRKSCIICVEPENGISCDIRYLGKKSTQYRISKLLKRILSLDKRVKDLVVVLRCWAEMCGIHEAENGRLHPLALVLMVIHYLQQTHPQILPIVDINVKAKPVVDPTDRKSVGELWLDLLKYYASEFDWLNHAISIIKPSPVPKENYKWGNCWIGIEAPFDASINIAKSVVSQDVASYIQLCFSRTYKYFSEPTKKLENNSGLDSGYGSPVLALEPEYNYTFCASNFTSGTHNPVVCEECEALGYTCDDCAEEGVGELETLPAMTETFLQKINDALRKTYDTHIISEEELKQRLDLVSDIQKYVRYRFKDAELELMGSSKNGFGFRNSDLDICLTFHNKQKLEFFEIRKIVRQLCFHLRRNKDFGSVFALYSAKIPLIQFHHAKSNRHGDISLYNLLALHNTKLLHCYSLIDERAKILGCAMKLLAKNACIADTAQKSLSSYSYVLMVIHYLQRTDPPVLPALQELYSGSKSPEIIVEGHNVWFFNDLSRLSSVWKIGNKNMQSIGELWLGLLKYYTEEFDCTEVASVRHSKKIAVSKETKKAKLFNIEDPFLTFKNLGSVMSEEMSIRTLKTFRRARKLFGTPISQPPSGFKSFEEYFFHPMNLTDGKVMKHVECGLCGKMGHKDEKCTRFSWSINRGRGNYGRGRHLGSRGFSHQTNHNR